MRHRTPTLSTPTRCRSRILSRENYVGPEHP